MKQYKVFLSSTYKDLAEHRRFVIEELRAHQFFVSPMEEWPASHPAPKVFAPEQIDGCDLFVLLVAYRRGHIPKGGNLSITQMEYNYAIANGIDILHFQLMDDACWTRSFDELDKDPPIREWRSELRERHKVSFFNHFPDSIKIGRALVAWLAQRRGSDAYQRTGWRLRVWVKPDYPPDPYPLLWPYKHPELFAGRDTEVREVRQELLNRGPILGFYSTSGAGKSSLLLAGLIPSLVAEGHIVAYTDRPEDFPASLLDGPNISRREVEPQLFTDFLSQIGASGGKIPILILDQFEDLIRSNDLGAQEKVASLIAATIRSRPQPVCHWLLSYRDEFHGQVDSWLKENPRDRYVLKPSLFNSYRLKTFGTAHRKSASPDSSTQHASLTAFKAAIEAPLKIKVEGRRKYPLNFINDGGRRLAKAFSEARLREPDSPLVPELQVVLRERLKDSGWPNAEEVKVHIPESAQDLERTIAHALQNHLEGALATVITSREDARKLRAKVLLVLRELSEQGQKGLPTTDMVRGFGRRGQDILQRLSGRDVRLIRPISPDAESYVFSHASMADIVVRRVNQTTENDELVDSEVVRLYAFVANRVSHFRGGDEKESTNLTTEQFRKIEACADTLLWEAWGRKWWSECKSRRAERERQRKASSLNKRRRAVSFAKWAAFLTVLTAPILFIQLRSRRINILLDLHGKPASQVVKQLKDLHYWGADRERISDALLAAKSWNGDLLRDVFLGANEEDVLLIVQLLQTTLQKLLVNRPLDRVSLEATAAAIWALDKIAARHTQSPIVRRADALRGELVSALRAGRGQPPEIGEKHWATIREGTFYMKSKYRPDDDILLETFALLKHEVTNRELAWFYEGWTDEAESRPNAPAVNVTWYEAYAFAAWLGGRLPTEEEWEYAARSEGEDREYPWDDPLSPSNLGRNLEGERLCEFTIVQGCSDKPLTVCSRRTGNTLQDVCDMAGNVWEWTANLYAESPVKKQLGPWGGGGRDRVIRGGGFNSPKLNAKTTSRDWKDPADEQQDIGFRVVLARVQ